MAGETGLMADMRHFNAGRPTGYFDVFFQELINQVEQMTAANDRRHGVAHMSEWLSLRDLVDKVAAACPAGTPIPSKALVRLQFTPTNPYTRTALSFTSKIPVQRKIQRRQLRAQHPDSHYCNALLKYLKKRTVQLQEKGVLVCSDDKAKIKVGEPGTPVSTGVRGRESLAPVSAELCALDHDMCKASITPSVVLKVKLDKQNETAEQSFVRGKVTTILNDSALQPSSPFRHAAMLVKMFQRDPASIPKVLLKYSDGGCDQRNTLESVRCSLISIFKELSLDMLIASRCAPGQSFVNPAERVMSILNIGLQNCATERQKMPDSEETLFKRCSSVTEVRQMADKHPNLKNEWGKSMESVQATVGDRFSRLKLKEEPIEVIDPVADQEIDILQRHLRALFPTLDLRKLQKQHTNKNEDYQKWKLAHCHETHYTFQIKRCADSTCCLPSELEQTDLEWLPQPVLDHTGNHFLSYEVLNGTAPTEKDRPSMKCPTRASAGSRSAGKSATRASSDTTSDQDPGPSTSSTSTSDDMASEVSHSTQHARATATCVECRKPRVVYSRLRLSQRQEVLLATSLSESDYTCGAFLFPPSSSSKIQNVPLLSL